jgi:spoIIIJ-associated protein
MTKKAENQKGKKLKDKDLDWVRKVSNKLLKLMGTKAKAGVSYDEDNEAIVVKIDAGDEAGLLIGNRGLTLNSIQSILGMIYQRKKGEWQRIFVDIADWREKEEERLNALAQQAAERAITTGESQTLYNLTASQRRLIHLFLSEDKSVETESTGEGRDRFLIISPKK